MPGSRWALLMVAVGSSAVASVATLFFFSRVAKVQRLIAAKKDVEVIGDEDNLPDLDRREAVITPSTEEVGIGLLMVAACTKKPQFRSGLSRSLTLADPCVLGDSLGPERDFVWSRLFSLDHPGRPRAPSASSSDSGTQSYMSTLFGMGDAEEFPDIDKRSSQPARGSISRAARRVGYWLDRLVQPTDMSLRGKILNAATVMMEASGEGIREISRMRIKSSVSDLRKPGRRT